MALWIKCLLCRCDDSALTHLLGRCDSTPGSPVPERLWRDVLSNWLARVAKLQTQEDSHSLKWRVTEDDTCSQLQTFPCTCAVHIRSTPMHPYTRTYECRPRTPTQFLLELRPHSLCSSGYGYIGRACTRMQAYTGVCARAHPHTQTHTLVHTHIRAHPKPLWVHRSQHLLGPHICSSLRRHCPIVPPFPLGPDRS